MADGRRKLTAMQRYSSFKGKCLHRMKGTPPSYICGVKRRSTETPLGGSCSCPRARFDQCPLFNGGSK